MSEEIKTLQEISNFTWPPKISLNLNGWKIRISEGITKRVNSVSPVEYSGGNLNEDILAVENYYRANNLPSIFQLHDTFEPASLQNKLLSLDYEIKDETIVMMANIDEINLSYLNEKFEFLLLEGELDKWLTELQIINQADKPQIDGRREIIGRIAQSNVGYFIAGDNEKTVAVGLAVLQENYMVIYSMFTHPDYRRKGIAQTILAKMIEWGDVNLVDRVFLQVESESASAINLYKKVGFKEKYRYRYLIKEF
ncbi:MAG: GNAT family N-acetyltransferase [Candidatus Heimdallarchaeota archaeon]|nr:GNAT family N-acetyltransferase [Candidatus Heimdallarchaeota archaeon]MCK4877523.1 GNAT family N-acetyltransferase [Candidatus Heimdallarchaeota archaeon]